MRCSCGGWRQQNLHFSITFESANTIHHKKIILSRCDISPQGQIIFSWWGEGEGHFFIIWDGRNFGTIGQLLNFERAKLLKIEFLIEILTIWQRDHENHVVISSKMAFAGTMSRSWSVCIRLKVGRGFELLEKLLIQAILVCYSGLSLCKFLCLYLNSTEMKAEKNCEVPIFVNFPSQHQPLVAMVISSCLRHWTRK